LMPAPLPQPYSVPPYGRSVRSSTGIGLQNLLDPANRNTDKIAGAGVGRWGDCATGAPKLGCAQYVPKSALGVRSSRRFSQVRGVVPRALTSGVRIPSSPPGRVSDA
jgi:hypothetical protein